MSEEEFKQYIWPKKVLLVRLCGPAFQEPECRLSSEQMYIYAVHTCKQELLPWNL